MEGKYLAEAMWMGEFGMSSTGREGEGRCVRASEFTRQESSKGKRV